MNWRSTAGAVWSGTEPLSVGAACAFALLIFVLFVAGFSANQPCLMLGLDGTWYRTMFDYEAIDRAWFTQTGVDALSGNFDAWYPLRPEFLLPHSLGLLFGSTAPSKTFIFVVFSTFLATAIYAVARCIGTGRATALTAALLMPILAGAGLADGVAQLYPLFEANPYWFQSTGLGCLMVTAAWALDGQRPGRASLLASVPTGCLLLGVVSLAPHMLFTVPIAAAYSAGSLLTVRRLADLIWRIMAALLAVALSVMLGVFGYYYGIIGYTAYRFFPQEIQHPLGGLVAASTVFWTPLGALVIILGIVGALWSSLVGEGRLRLFAVTHLLVTAVFFLVAYWLAFVALSYRSSWPVYFETGIWPFALIFSATAVSSALRLLSRSLIFPIQITADWLSHVYREISNPDARSAAPSPSDQVGRVCDWLMVRSSAFLLAVCVVTVAIHDLRVILSHQESYCAATGFFPIRATSITKILEQEVALRPGTPFRGMVATIDGTQPGKPGDWIDFHDRDAVLWQDTGNDHRAVGLWHFKIPTLFQYHTFITPPYYLTVTDFLSKPADHQLRSSLVLTQINPAMMALWGVRYVITDKTNTPGHEIARLPTAHSGTLRLLELPNPNLGDYSPVQVIRAETFAQALRVMHRPDFDGRHVVTAETSIEQPLVPATGAKLVYTQEGFHLTALSTGHSVLVLPAQYSHCWTAAGDGKLELFRADAMQLGIAFAGKLEVRLIFRLGPILAGSCRVQDLRDMKRLQINSARNWPH